MVLCISINIFIFLISILWQYTNFSCSHINHPFHWDSLYILSFVTHFYTCRIHKEPHAAHVQWWCYSQSSLSLYLFHLWLIQHEESLELLVGKWRKNDWTWGSNTFYSFTLKGSMLFNTAVCEDAQVYKLHLENRYCHPGTATFWFVKETKLTCGTKLVLCFPPEQN